MSPRILLEKTLKAQAIIMVSCARIADRAGLEFSGNVTGRGSQMIALKKLEAVAAFLKLYADSNASSSVATITKVDDLTLIDGITPETAVALYTSGIWSREDVANMTTVKMIQIPGIGAAKAKKIKAAALAQG